MEIAEELKVHEGKLQNSKYDEEIYWIEIL